MLSKLRTDIRQKLKDVKHLVVNGDLFNGYYSPGESNETDPTELGLSASRLKEIDVGIIVYSLRLNSLAGELSNFTVCECAVGDLEGHLNQNGNIVNFGDSAFLAFSDRDISLMSRFAFSFTPASASLETKMRSAYSSHNDGVVALLEVCDLVISAKTYPYGFGK